MLPIPRRWLFPALASLVLCLVPSPATAQTKQKSYLFCFWNVENLFDDKLDKREPPDREIALAEVETSRAVSIDSRCTIEARAQFPSQGREHAGSIRRHR